MLARPGFLSMAAGADLLSGLETAGPYMFLVVSAAGIAVGFGLLRLQNWARRIAALLALIGIVLLVPRVSSAVVAARISALAWSGLGIIVRVVIVFSLYQASVREIFETQWFPETIARAAEVSSLFGSSFRRYRLSCRS